MTSRSYASSTTLSAVMHEACDTYTTLTSQPPAQTMNVYPQNPTLAQQQADSLNGNALRSLRQFKDNLVHAVWFFANKSNAFPAKASVARIRKVAKHTSRFKYRGHRVARTR